MRVRWTSDAADDLERICDYIAEDRPQAARQIAVDITLAIGGLSAFPNRGRPGRVDDTRELVLAPLPFIAVYEVTEEQGRPNEVGPTHRVQLATVWLTNLRSRLATRA